LTRESSSWALTAPQIDWVFADGERLERYAFVDITRRIYAYDYARSAMIVETENGRRRLARLVVA
jgi:hypothetical protein